MCYIFGNQRMQGYQIRQFHQDVKDKDKDKDKNKDKDKE